MSYSLTKLGRLALKTQSAWGTAETSFSATDYLECSAPFIPPLAREALRTDTFRPDFTEPVTVPGSKAPTDVQIGGPLHGWSTATPSADATVTPELLLMSRVMGGITAGAAYTTALAGSSTTTVANITNGAASATWEGFAQNIPVSGGRAIAWIATVDTGASPDTLTYAAAIAAAQSASGTNYGSIMAYLTAGYDLSPMTFQWLGSAAADQTRYFDAGCTSFEITLETKRQPMWSATLRALDWTAIGSGGAPSGYTYGFPQMPAWTGTNGARSYLAGTARCYQKVVIRVTQDLVEVPCNSSSQGVSQWIATNRRITVECIRAVTDTSAITAAPGDSTGVLQVDFNTTPGRAGSLLLPASYVLEQPQTVDLGGVMGERVLYGALPYTADGSGGTASDTPGRLALL